MGDLESLLSYSRGDVVEVTLPRTNHKNVQQGFRPVVIIQNNTGNLFSPTLIVAPLTTNLKKEDQPTHVLIKSRILKYDSMALLEQLHTINKSNIKRRLGRLEDAYINRINKALATSVALTEYIQSLTEEKEQEEQEEQEPQMDSFIDEMRKNHVDGIMPKTKIVELMIRKGLEEKIICETLDITKAHWYKLKSTAKKAIKASDTFIEDRPYTRLNDEEKALMYQMMDDGISHTEIAKKFNTTYAAIRAHFYRRKSAQEQVAEVKAEHKAEPINHEPGGEKMEDVATYEVVKKANLQFKKYVTLEGEIAKYQIGEVIQLELISELTKDNLDYFIQELIGLKAEL